MYTSTVIFVLLSMASITLADIGTHSVHLGLAALTPTPVTTTVTLAGIEKSVTVTADAPADIVIDYRLTSDQVRDNEPILLEVSTVTKDSFLTDTVQIYRTETGEQSIAGLVRITVSRSKCAKDYYGPFCSMRCRDNATRHWKCTSEGMRTCADGWQGPRCDRRVCPTGCRHGHCDGTCLCYPGYTGPACDQCVPTAGCLNGACRNSTPGTCVCREGWTGPLCNIDLSKCSASRSPCAAGSTCFVKSLVDVICICPEGKTGSRCDIVLPPAARHNLCRNGGTYQAGRASAPMCQCPQGFSGVICDVPTTEPVLINHNLLITLNVVLCLVVLVVGVVLIVMAIRFVKSSAPCGPPSSALEGGKTRQQPKLSSVSLLIPDGLDAVPCKGDDLFTAAKQHSGKVVSFTTLEEPRYTSCPSKPSIFSIPEAPTVTSKVYETLPL